jgi:uncharacterized membrane protein
MKKLPDSLDYNPVEQPRTVTDKAFRISLYLKGLDGLLEIVGGILLLLITPEQIQRLALWLTHGELSEDPHDFFASHVFKTAHHLTGASLTFGAVYLLSHGIVKVVLVAEVMRDRLWAYIALIAFTILFIIYQTYRMVVDFTIGMLLLTIFDLIIIYLTQNEYRKHQHRLKKS